MKTGYCRALGFLAIALIFFPIAGFSQEKKEMPAKLHPSEKDRSHELKGKFQEEMERVRKDASQAGKEIKESFKELPGQASKDFKKTGNSLKEAGKEVEEGTASSWQRLKNLFRKK